MIDGDVFSVIEGIGGPLLMCKDEENGARAETHHNIRAELTCPPSLLIYPGNFLSCENNNKKTRLRDISRSILKVSSRAYKTMQNKGHKTHIYIRNKKKNHIDIAIRA